jgi:hypothetical protein
MLAKHAVLCPLLVAVQHHHLHNHNKHCMCVQICYMLGAAGHSFVIGYGRRPPRCPHHRDSALCMAQSGDWQCFNCKGPNPNELTGALCGGPLESGQWKDDRADYKGNEVALDYNAALIIGTVQCLVSATDASSAATSVTSAPVAAAMVAPVAAHRPPPAAAM